MPNLRLVTAFNVRPNFLSRVRESRRRQPPSSSTPVRPMAAGVGISCSALVPHHRLLVLLRYPSTSPSSVALATTNLFWDCLSPWEEEVRVSVSEPWPPTLWLSGGFPTAPPCLSASNHVLHIHAAASPDQCLSDQSVHHPYSLRRS